MGSFKASWLAVGGLLALGFVIGAGCGDDDDPITPTTATGGLGGSGGVSSGGAGGEGGACLAQIVCTGDVAHACNEPASSGTDCAAIGRMCVPLLGCSLCDPADDVCTQDGASSYCKSDGSGVIEFVCDADLGLSCQGNSCQGACAPAVIEDSYIGCEYFPTSALNNINNSYKFEVAVANSSATEAATVKITGGGLASTIERTVAADSVARIELPWVQQVKVCNESSLGNGFDQVNACSAAHAVDFSSRVVSGGAYRLASNLPVAVYQFAPIEVVEGTFQSGVSEASLLVPQTTFGNRYRVALYGTGFSPGALAIVPTIDGTTVTVTPSADVMAGAGQATVVSAGQSAQYTGDRGDVIELINVPDAPESNTGDLSGSLIESDHPIQVIASHGCAWVGTAGSCSHLEDSMLPEAALDREYLVKDAVYPSATGYWLRVVALQDDTTVTFEPATVSAPVTLAKAGDMVELGGSGALAAHISGDKPILAAGLIDAQSTMAPLVPVARYRDDYLLYVPSFQNSYLKLFAASGTSVSVDGTAVPAGDWTAIGSSGFSWAIVADVLAGPHRATGDGPFGVMVYGYQQGEAMPGGLPSGYEYPGGLDLQSREPLPVPN